MNSMWSIPLECTTESSSSASRGCGRKFSGYPSTIKKKHRGYSFYHQCEYCGNHIHIRSHEIPHNVQEYAGSWTQWLNNLL